MKKLLFIILLLISTSANAWTSQTYLKSFTAQQGVVTLNFSYLEYTDLNNKDTFVFHHILAKFNYKGTFKELDKVMVILDCSDNEKPMILERYSIGKNNKINKVISTGRHSINEEAINNYCNNESPKDTKIMFEVVNEVLEKNVLSNFGEHEFKMRRKALDIIKVNEQRL